MKTYSFIVGNSTVVHVDIYTGYGYAEARSLIRKVYPEDRVQFIPIVMLHRRRNHSPNDEIKIPFIPFGYVCSLECQDWKEYFYG